MSSRSDRPKSKETVAHSRSNASRPESPRSPSSLKRVWRFDSPPKASTALAHMHGLVDLQLDELRLKRQAAEAALRQSELEQEKMARELFVGGLPMEMSLSGVIDALNDLLVGLGAAIYPGKPILTGWMGADSQFCFIELRTAEECHNALRLNGFMFKGRALRVGRPKAYKGSLGNQVTASRVEALSGFSEVLALPAPIEDSTTEERLVLCGVREGSKESDIKALLEFFGELAFFCKIDETCYLFEFKKAKNQRALISALPSQTSFGDLAAIRPVDAVSYGYMSFDANCMLQPSARGVPSRALWIRGFNGTSQELIDECENTGGKVKECNSRSAEQIPDNIKSDIFVIFDSVPEAVRIRRRLDGRRFGERKIFVDFFSERKFQEHEFDDPKLNEDIPDDRLVIFEDPVFEILRPLPKIKNGKIISWGISQEPVIVKKPKKMTPEDYEIID